MKGVNDIQKLLKRQKSYQKNIVVMVGKLFDIQNQIGVLTQIELNKKNEIGKGTTDLLTTRDVCNMLGVSQSTLYRMRTNDGFPFIKIEGRKGIMYNKKDIEEFLKKQKP